MQLIRFLSCAILIALTAMAATAEEIPILGEIPADIQEIDLTYSESGPPRLSFRSTLSPRPVVASFRPSSPQFDLLSVLRTATLTGPCETSQAGQSILWTVTIRAGAADPCQVAVTVQQSAAVDVLPYDTVRLKGYASHPALI